jgi:F-type H+-transporting ATPase subunit a
MVSRSLKSLLVAAFSLISLLFSPALFAQDGTPKMGQADDSSAASGEKAEAGKKGEKLDPSTIILEHVADGHEFHFFTIAKNPVSIPLPVILYSPAPGKGWSIFMSSAFQHG